MKPQTASLVERARSGEQAALAALIREYTPGVYRFAYRMVGSEEEARDVAQETFLRMIRNLERYDSHYSFSTWLYRITRNLCIDRARFKFRWRFSRSSKEKDLDEEDPVERLPTAEDTPLDNMLTMERKKAIEIALEKLKPNYREVLVLFHFEELSYQEIAHVLQVPIGTVMNRIYRARQHMKVSLGDV